MCMHPMWHDSLSQTVPLMGSETSPRCRIQEHSGGGSAVDKLGSDVEDVFTDHGAGLPV
jgi:hypothetical protein